MTRKITVEEINGEMMTKTIPLTRGYEAIVDAADYDWLNQWKWYAKPNKTVVYAVRMRKVDGKRKNIWMHREILMNPVGKNVDHINRNGLDNRRCNLRAVSPGANQFNKTPTRNNTGVYFHNRDKVWTASIGKSGKVHHLGNFSTKEEAIEARKRAEREYWPGIITHATDSETNERVDVAIKESE